MGWLIHGAVGGWKGIATDRHDECAPLLLAAGLTVDEAALPTGNDALDRVLREWFVKRVDYFAATGSRTLCFAGAGSRSPRMRRALS